MREYKDAHDSLGSLLLVTDTATVTEVERMSHDRSDEAMEALRDILEAYDVSVDGDDAEALRGAVEDLHPEDARGPEALVGRVERPEPMLVSLTVDPNDGFDFAAGQYVGVRYTDTSRAYSIASSPGRKDVEFCVRRVPEGRLSPRLCDDARPGDEVTLRGPHGELVLGEPSSRDTVFLATGTGVAPFKSMIDHLFEQGLDEYSGERRDVWLILGAAWLDDLPYHEEFSALADTYDNFHYVPTLSREPYLTNWDGETDYVQHTFLKHVDPHSVRTPAGKPVERRLTSEPESDVTHRIEPKDVDVYACGINAMVYSLVAAAESVGVPPERIESEGFG